MNILGISLVICCVSYVCIKVGDRFYEENIFNCEFIVIVYN